MKERKNVKDRNKVRETDKVRRQSEQLFVDNAYFDHGRAHSTHRRVADSLAIKLLGDLLAVRKGPTS